MLEQLKEQWDNILLHVKEEHDIMDVSFNTWLLPLKIFAVDGNVVKILAPDAQMLRYIQKKYGLILQVSIEEVTGFACTLDFITEDDVKEKRKTGKNADPEYSWRCEPDCAAERQLKPALHL